LNLPFPSGRQDKRRVLLDAVESVREVITTGAEQAEREGTLPPATVDALYDSRLMALKLPVELGGAEVDPVTLMDVIEAMALYDATAAWVLMVGATSIGLAGAFLPGEAIQQIFTDDRVPRSVGVAAPGGDAEPTDGGFNITAHWTFGSGTPHAEWISGGVRVPGVKGGPPEIRRAIFRSSDAQIHDNWQVAGLRGTGSCDFSVSNLFVPEEFTFTPGGVPRRGGPLFLLGRAGFVIPEHAGVALGLGFRSLNSIIELAKSKSRGTSNRYLIANRPAFQGEIGQMEIRLRAARSLMVNVLEEAWEVASQGSPVSLEFQSIMRSCCVYVTETAMDAVNLAFRNGGGEALRESSDLQQCLRDMHGVAQHYMVSRTSYEAHGQHLLGMTDVDLMR